VKTPDVKEKNMKRNEELRDYIENCLVGVNLEHRRRHIPLEKMYLSNKEKALEDFIVRRLSISTFEHDDIDRLKQVTRAFDVTGNQRDFDRIWDNCVKKDDCRRKEIVGGYIPNFDENVF
jgi:hypothetical protein